MTSATLQKEIEQAIPKLLDIARDLTYNIISDNCQFILTEIWNEEENTHVQRQLNKIENDKKIPVSLPEMIPALQKLYEDLYDINLYIYLATENLTVIDIRYYSKLSLDADYREKVKEQPPMLHCKVTWPYWLPDRNEKFDINWEHEEEWKMEKKEPDYVASLVNEETKEILANQYKTKRMVSGYFFIIILLLAVIYFIIEAVI